MAELTHDARAEDFGSQAGSFSLHHSGVDGKNAGPVFSVVFAVHSDAPSTMMANDVKFRCHSGSPLTAR
jgi:hypothetical protein